MFDGRNFEPEDKYLRNLLIARRRWMDTPPERVIPRLAWYSSECGTLACFGGHLAKWPEFQEQGVFAIKSGAPRIEGGHNAYGTAKVLFGCVGLFECCPVMQEPHAVVLRRLDAAIESRRRALASVTVEETCSEGAEEVWPSWCSMPRGPMIALLSN